MLGLGLRRVDNLGERGRDIMHREFEKEGLQEKVKTIEGDRKYGEIRTYFSTI
jgi:hypothetical protein